MHLGVSSSFHEQGEIRASYHQFLVSIDDVLENNMKVALLSVFLVCLASLAAGETINSLSTHTNSCLFCGMVEGVGYITAKVRQMIENTRVLKMISSQVCGSTDCCLSRSLDADGHVDWLPGQTDTFAGEG